MHPRKVNTARKIEISRLRGPIVVTPTEREVEPSPISGGSPPTSSTCLASGP